MIGKAVVALVALTLAVSAAAFAPSPARAHAGAPYWTAQQAANTLVSEDIEWEEGVDTVMYARCRGVGRHVGIRFKHFRCYVEVLEDDPYRIMLHTAWDGFTADFIDYD